MSQPTTSTHEVVQGSSLWADAWKRWKKHRISVVSSVILAFIVLACLAGPALVEALWGWTYEMQDIDLGGPEQAEHVLAQGCPPHARYEEPLAQTADRDHRHSQSSSTARGTKRR